jgi:hypothetical protein
MRTEPRKNKKKFLKNVDEKKNGFLVGKKAFLVGKKKMAIKKSQQISDT